MHSYILRIKTHYVFFLQFHPESLTPIQHSSQRSSKDGWSRIGIGKGEFRTRWPTRECGSNYGDASSHKGQIRYSRNGHLRGLWSYPWAPTCKNTANHMASLWFTSWFHAIVWRSPSVMQFMQQAVHLPFATKAYHVVHIVAPPIVHTYVQSHFEAHHQI